MMPQNKEPEDEQYISFVRGLETRNQDLVKDTEKVKERICWFDEKIRDICLEYPTEYDRYAGSFLTSRNYLARYLHDKDYKEKTWEDYKPSISKPKPRQ